MLKRNKIMTTVALCALATPIAACSESPAVPVEAPVTTETTESIDMEVRKAAAMRPDKDHMSVESILDADIDGPGGDEVAEIEDLIIGQDGKITTAILDGDTFLDLKDRDRSLAFTDLNIALLPDGDDFDTVVTFKDMDDARMAALPQFDWDAITEHSRATKLIGAIANFGEDRENAMIKDLLVGPDGTLKYVIIGDGRLGTDYAIDYSKLTISGKDVILAITEESLETARLYDYKWDD